MMNYDKNETYYEDSNEFNWSWCHLCKHCQTPCISDGEMIESKYSYNGTNPPPRCFITQKDQKGVLTPKGFHNLKKVDIDEGSSLVTVVR